MRIAFLGLGAMGQQMARRLLDAGHQVTIWNRTAAAAEPLVAAGAAMAPTPAVAVAGAEVAFAMLRDDAASRAVWLGANGALDALPEGAVAVESSTLSIPWVTELGRAFAAVDRVLIDAPVAGSLPQAEVGALIFLTGGPGQDVEALAPAFAPMSGATHHLGALGAGTAMKLFVNAALGTQMALVAELIGFADHTGLDPGRAVDVFAKTPVASPVAGMAGAAMLSDNFPPAFPITLLEKDLGYLAASASGAALPVSTAVRAVFAEAMAHGFGADNMTGVVQLYRQGPG